MAEFSFVYEPDDALKCLICFEVAEEPWQHDQCGRLFCRKCLDQYRYTKPCPNCRAEQPQYFVDTRGKRDIQALRVKCLDRDCKWEGTVGTLEAHVATCEFTLVPCPKECKNDKNEIAHFTRKDLDKHLENYCPNRDLECELCGEKGTNAHMTQVHDSTCKMKIVPCPNTDCTKTIQRRNVKRHLEECGYSEIPCKYQRLGCGVKTQRKYMSVHGVDDKLHLHMALDKVISMEEEITTIKNKEATEVLKRGESIAFKLTEYQDKKDHSERFLSPTFYSSRYGYHMKVSAYANGNKGEGCGTQVSMYLCVLNGKNDKELNWPFVGKVTFQMLNQLEDSNHFQKLLFVTKEMNIMVGISRGYRMFALHSALSHDPVRNTQYLKDDTLYFRVSVDIPDHKPWLECTAK